MSAWLQELLVALLWRVLQGLAKKAEKRVEDARDKAERDEQRGIRDSKNVDAYYKAKSRADKIRSMLDLANRSDS